MPSGYSTTGTPTNTNQMDWTQTAIGLGSGLIGMLGQNRRERRAMENQETLMGIQSRNQMRLNQQGADLQYDMWKKTNYPAQVEMLKEAGLNPGLIYGSAGAGGTTGSQSGGSAQSGNAPSPQPIDIQSALNVAMSKAQIEVAKSQANKNDAEAEAIGGYKKGQAEQGIEESKQNVAESIARSLNIKEDTAKKIAETSNIKSMKDLNEIKEKVETQLWERGQKGFIKGDTIGNIFETIGLDPKNNKEDQTLVRVMLGAWFGAGMVQKITNAIPWFKFGGKGKTDKAWGKGFKEGIDHMKPGN